MSQEEPAESDDAKSEPSTSNTADGVEAAEDTDAASELPNSIKHGEKPPARDSDALSDASAATETAGNKAVDDGVHLPPLSASETHKDQAANSSSNPTPASSETEITDERLSLSTFLTVDPLDDVKSKLGSASLFPTSFLLRDMDDSASNLNGTTDQSATDPGRTPAQQISFDTMRQRYAWEYRQMLGSYRDGTVDTKMPSIYSRMARKMVEEAHAPVYINGASTFDGLGEAFADAFETFQRQIIKETRPIEDFEDPIREIFWRIYLKKFTWAHVNALHVEIRDAITEAWRKRYGGTMKIWREIYGPLTQEWREEHGANIDSSSPPGQIEMWEQILTITMTLNVVHDICSRANEELQKIRGWGTSTITLKSALIFVENTDADGADDGVDEWVAVLDSESTVTPSEADSNKSA